MCEDIGKVTTHLAKPDELTEALLVVVATGIVVRITAELTEALPVVVVGIVVGIPAGSTEALPVVVVVVGTVVEITAELTEAPLVVVVVEIVVRIFAGLTEAILIVVVVRIEVVVVAVPISPDDVVVDSEFPPAAVTLSVEELNEVEVWSGGSVEVIVDVVSITPLS